MSKRIGIFAGTFDPIHEGHLAFAHAALKAGVEKVMFMPEPRPRRKQGVRAFEHRVAMVQRAVADEPRLGTIILEQVSFTPHETLPILQERFKGYELALLFGDDVVRYMADHIAAWPHIEDIASTASLVIAARQEEKAALTDTLRTLKSEYGLPFRYTFVAPDRPGISSSKIRLALKHGKPVQGLPTTVMEYIRKAGLYVDEMIS